MNPDHRQYADALGEGLPGADIGWLSAQRQNARASFNADGFPSPRDEDWRYSNVAAIEKKRFKPALTLSDSLPDLSWLDAFRVAGAWSLVFVDGHYAGALSHLEGLPDGVIIHPLSAALAADPASLPESEFGRVVADTSRHGFVAFNTAFFTDGLLLHVPEDMELHRPIQLIHVAVDSGIAANIRNMIVLERGARASVIETHLAEADTGSLTTSITEAIVRERARLDCYTLHGPSDRAFRFGGTYAEIGRSAGFQHTNLSLGGLLVRNEIHADLSELGECQLDGLFVGQGRRHVDNHTLIRHRGPYGTSRETYRGILDERARGVFQGRIVVEPLAQKTDAQMNNRNLLLSEEAEIDTKPQLEIHADDVKCAHGVAVGQLDPESIFYLESRGIDAPSARNMLTFAFANAMIDGIASSGFREVAQKALLSVFPQAGIRKDWL